VSSASVLRISGSLTFVTTGDALHAARLDLLEVLAELGAGP
jgi:hypothetical protein